MSKFLKSALSIDELAYTLGNIAHDDKLALESYSDAELLAEARYVLGLFTNPAEGHINGEDYRGENGPEQKTWARSQVRKLRTLIARMEAAAQSGERAHA